MNTLMLGVLRRRDSVILHNYTIGSSHAALTATAVDLIKYFSPIATRN